MVGNGLEALKAIHKDEFDLVLMDCHMPKLDGFSATEKIRLKKTKFSKIPIIALTADVLTSTQKKCSSVGMNGFVSKPIDADALFNTIETIHAKIRDNPNGFHCIEPAPTKDPNQLIDHEILNALSALNTTGTSDFVDDLIQSFLVKTPQKFAEMKVSLDHLNLKELFSRAHSFKSVAAALGASLTANAAEKLERSSLADLMPESAQNLKELEASFERTRKEFLKLKK